MRRIHITLGIALLLLWAQQGALLHEINHIGRVHAQAGASVQQSLALEKTCDLCAAFSQVSTPAGNSVHKAVFEPYACLVAAHAPCAAISASVPTPRSRGPPAA